MLSVLASELMPLVHFLLGRCRDDERGLHIPSCRFREEISEERPDAVGKRLKNGGIRKEEEWGRAEVEGLFRGKST